MPNISAADLERTVIDIFSAAGCSAAEASRIAHYLVAANLTGHDSHGVARIARYVPLLREGVVHADQKVDVLVDTPAIAVVDGKYGFGQTVAPQAVALGVEKCKSMGLSAIALRNSGHVGRLSDWAEIAAREGLVSIHFCNAAGSVLVAPFGSAERRFSTAPYCVGVPLAGREPLLLDFATSIVAEGKVFVASQGGRPIPNDALIGPDGPSDDARLLYGDYPTTGKRDLSAGKGAIRAFGDHKGSGLALMCELLGGALSGTGATRPDRGRVANGMFSLYIDPARLDPASFFPQEVTRYVDFVKQAKPAPGAQVLMPGEPEQAMRAQRLREGVPLPDETWQSLLDAGRLAGLNAAWVADAQALRK